MLLCQKETCNKVWSLNTKDVSILAGDRLLLSFVIGDPTLIVFTAKYQKIQKDVK